ncbi:metallophosphoesterase [Flavobacterium tegetincola]|uniref:metallophosphoesterase n=1 Tax=Flavobacterium tegetincola TaxID=150172 RepID=UPI00047E9BA1|nr:metallophosphoesterase [Flavobacterium tegetincola]
MKLFHSNYSFKFFKVLFIFALTLLTLSSCAVKEPKYGKNAQQFAVSSAEKSEIQHTFYLIGDAGNADKEAGENTLGFLKEKLKSADENSTLLFLGDNIYPDGLPKKDDENRKLAEKKLDNQLDLAKDFLGKTIFIPGNHDWYNNGLKGLKRQEDYINEALKEKKSFMPRESCAIDKLSISDNLELITIDSQWFLEDWNDSPTINEGCDVKSREEFFTELESVLNKNQSKTMVIAIHHPLMTNGTHGGQFSLEKQLFPLESKIPLPIIGSLVNFLRKTSGISPQDLQNKKYSELANRIKALIQSYDNVVVVSGHDHNLQYIEKNNVKQIISGSGSKLEAARAINEKDFSAGMNGYAVLEIGKNGDAFVSFYGVNQKKEQLLYSYKVLSEKKVTDLTFNASVPEFKEASIYSKNRTSKSAFYKFLWGNHYRDVYSQNIKAPTVLLDTLFGGLKPLKAGGGHQSKSLRLEDSTGKEFVMRGLKKSATRFIQALAFKDQSIENEFNNTYTEDFLLDFYTSSHPYTPFAVGNLAEAVGVSHANPILFYVPKQKTLMDFNAEYGDELYMIEERPMEEFKGYESFGSPENIVSTDDVLANLIKDEKYEIDEASYIRARLFDMLIGDWDRHSDQWRWGEFRKNEKVIYKPIPRDRDQAFPKYGGVALTIVLTAPELRHMQEFASDIRNVKWFNMEPYPMDLKFLKTADAKVWKEQADFIKLNLTDAVIDTAFDVLPEEVQDATIEEIKNTLRLRKEKLNDFAQDYFKVLQRTAVLVGTNKKDKFIITRLPKGKTEVQVFRLKKDGEEFQYTRLFDKNETKQIWIYGLEGDDVFEVKGKESGVIRLKIIGGANNDLYEIENGKRVTLFDYKTKNNVFIIDNKTRKIVSDSYELNKYDYKKPKYNAFAGYPDVGYNPDDGVKVGVSLTYKVNSFIRNPFSQKHNLQANYYFATEGYEFKYNGVFPNSINNWRLEMDAIVTTPNFSSNFFGFGNDTQNLDDDLGMNYNRIKMQTLGFAPSIHWQGDFGAHFSAKLNFRSVEVDRTANRFIVDNFAIDEEVFNTQNFLAAQVRYGFENYDNASIPTMGMKFYVEGGYEINLNESNKTVPYAETALGFSHKITKDDQLVFGTMAKAKMLFSNDYLFYQMAELGGDADLRAFRFQRFSGKQSFFITSDLRYKIGKFKNSLIPAQYGVFAGYDSGRVWLAETNSNKWHNSIGGGIWLNGVKVVTGKVSYFHGEDGGRFSVGLGFGF